MSSSFNLDSPVKAVRKQRRCYWCGELIPVGQPAIRSIGKFEGDFYVSYMHNECNAVLKGMSNAELDGFGILEDFEPHLFQRGTKELRCR
jgi:hypothetical protein